MEQHDEFAAASGPTRPRLFIKEMVMRNFKSYAGEQRVGPFHKVRVFLFCSSVLLFCFDFSLVNMGKLSVRFCKTVRFGAQSFTAVVGPNGSGKSNVIDAMLFVFGKRAKQVSVLECSFEC